MIGRQGFRTIAGATAAIGMGTIAVEVQAQSVPLQTPAGFEQGSDLKIGDFKLYNRLELGLKATDNIRQDPTEKSDLETQVSAYSGLESDWQRHALAFTAAYVRQEAVDTPDEEADALSGSVSGRIDVSKEWALTLGLQHVESIVGKNDPEEFSGNLNGTTTDNTAEAQLAWTGAKAFANLQTRYTDVENSTDLNIQNYQQIQNQDREEFDATLQVGRTYGWGKAYVFGGPLMIRYSGSATSLPEDRDSEGARGGVGLEYASGKFEAIFRLIGFAQYFDAPTIGEVVDVAGTFQVHYQVTDAFSVAGKLERTFDETNIQSSGGLFTNLVSVGAQYQFTDDVYLRFGPSLRHYEIEGTSLEADNVQFDATAAWQATKHVELMLSGTAYNQTVNDPSLADLSYNEAAVTLSTVITF